MFEDEELDNIDENEPESEEPVLTEEEPEEPPVTLRNSEQEVTAMADETVKKLKRSALLHYLNDAFNTTLSGASWFVIGKHVSDMSVEMNADTETVKNILDETSVIDNGYEPSFDVDTYFADPSDGDFYTALKDIVMNRKTGDDCKTLVLEVLIDKAPGNDVAYDAWVEEVVVKPTSYGGAQGGVRIPYTVTFSGNRVPGTVEYTGKVPTFTANS